MYVKKTAAAAAEPVEAGSKTSRQVLISATEGPNFAMRRFVIEPGGGMPTHTNTVEHEQYVLEGRAEIGIGEHRFEVEKDDVVFIPAAVPHWYKAIGDEAFEFLCVVPNKADKMELLPEPER